MYARQHTSAGTFPNQSVKSSQHCGLLCLHTCSSVNLVQTNGKKWCIVYFRSGPVYVHTDFLQMNQLK